MVIKKYAIRCGQFVVAGKGSGNSATSTAPSATALHPPRVDLKSGAGGLGWAASMS